MSSELTDADELRAAIGSAVTLLIRTGQPVTRTSLIATLTLIGSQTGDTRKQRICIHARSLLGELFT